MAELALPEIAKLKSPPLRGEPFEFCEYAATTITMNFCSSYASKIEDERRSGFYESLKSSMTQKQRVAFERLLAAKDAYIEAHAFEVDQGGSIRGVRTIGSQNILKRLFHKELVRFERKKWPVISANQIQRADGLLQREYEKTIQRLRKRSKEEIDQGAVSAEHVFAVQQVWGAYRDAWVQFARVLYPAAVDAIRAQITLDRYRLLKTM
jgi:uncharacterized protein YecT (DUF1311 family)